MSGAPPRRPACCPHPSSCLDVRENDAGDLVVTKGDKYDVREKDEAPSSAPSSAPAAAAVAGGGGEAAPPARRAVRNLGKPVELCARYYGEGADEVALLNITAFRAAPLEDLPLLAVLEAASASVFVPLTVRAGRGRAGAGRRRR